MKVLLTGASGFIGRALLPRLQKDDHVVFAAVRRPAGLPDERLIGNIGPATDWKNAVRGCEVVVHLASRVHVMRETATDSLAANREINTAGTLNLARQAAAAGVRRFVFASTVKVNGEGREQPYRENDEPAPEDAYAISKFEAEAGLRAISRETGMEIVILRFPLVYGLGVTANFLRLLQIVDRGLPLPFGSINNRRSLIYLGNLVDVISLSLAHPAASNKTWLVSDGEDVSTPVLVRRIATALGRPARLLPVPTGVLRGLGAVTGKRKEMGRLLGSLAVDSSAIRRELGWVPPYTMGEGLAETARWFREQKARHA